MAEPKTVFTYDLNGVNRLFSIPFEYLARKYIVATAIGATRKTLVLNTDYRFISATQIQTTVALGTEADGFTILELRRYTSATERLVTFNDGSILRATDMNLSQIQTLHVAEEARDLTSDTIGVNNAGDLDARGKKIVNVINGTGPFDAVNYGQLTNVEQSAGASAAASSASAADASTSAASALASKNSATTSATSASTSATSASTSASTASIKASEASANASTASTKASEASSSATASSNSATAASSSQADALLSKNSASSSASTATSKANEAATSAATAVTNATVATTKAADASGYATSASASASTATTKAGEAVISATSASTSAASATTKAGEAVISATSALTQANRAKSEADRAQGYANGLNLPSTTGNGGKYLRQKVDESGFEYAMIPTVPTGVITMWSGATTAVPSGWALCDGLNGTPNLRDRFIVGAGNTYAVGDTGGEATHILTTDELPSHTHEATVSYEGDHGHTVSGTSGGGGTHSHTVSGTSGGAGGHNHTTAIKRMLTAGSGGPTFAYTAQYNTTADVTYTSSAVGDHTHSFSATSSTVNNHTHSFSGISSIFEAHTHTVINSSIGSGTAHNNLPPYYALAYIMKL